MVEKPSSTLALRTQNLAKTYAIGFFRKKVRAITDVSLEVRQGEVFGLLGPNGAGKTTTLKVLMGLVRPSGGEAEVLGQPAGALAAKRRLGFLPETPYFYDYLTARELLILVGQLFGQTRRASRDKAAELIERVGLTQAQNRPLRRYSKGMLQRVGLAQALMNDPDLVVLDEPLTGLDPLGRKHLREVIVELGQQGKTVVLSSHILSDVEMLADRVAIIVRGRSVDSGPLDQLVNAQVLSIDVLVHQPSNALLQALREVGHELIRRGDIGHVSVADEASVDAVIDLVRAHRGSIRGVHARKETLEDVVVHRAEAGEATELSAP